MSPPRRDLLWSAVLGESVLVHSRLRLVFALTVAGIAALGLSACGRKGPLELPPGPASQTTPSAQIAPPPETTATPASGPAADAAAVKNGFDSHGNPVATPGKKQPFILDPLLQ
jgi:predicted small lipoprotein YifL